MKALLAELRTGSCCNCNRRCCKHGVTYLEGRTNTVGFCIAQRSCQSNRIHICTQYPGSTC